jgi:hypothetical protein
MKIYSGLERIKRKAAVLDDGTAASSLDVLPPAKPEK